jgi:putative peptide zinc metalloprotease protein
LTLLGVLAAVVPAGQVGRPPDQAERTVLLLVAALVVVTALAVRRTRPPAVGAGALLILAVLPWPGAGSAAVLAVAAAVVLAAVLIDGVVRAPVPQRPHPLLRGLVVVPAAVLIVVGMLFQPARAMPLPHAALAAWIQAPGAGHGTVSVPAQLWGDLVRDGVAPDRLARAGSGPVDTAEWTVEVGATATAGSPVARFGTGPAALVVLRSAHAEEDGQAARAGRAAPAVAEQQTTAALAARQAFGSSLAGNPRVQGAEEVVTALRDGSVDDRVLAALAALTADHDLGLAASPGWTVPDAAVAPRRDIRISSFDDRPTGSPDVAAELRDLLAALPLELAPSGIAEDADGLVVTWGPGVDRTADTWSLTHGRE